MTPTKRARICDWEMAFVMDAATLPRRTTAPAPKPVPWIVRYESRPSAVSSKRVPDESVMATLAIVTADEMPVRPEPLPVIKEAEILPPIVKVEALDVKAMFPMRTLLAVTLPPIVNVEALELRATLPTLTVPTTAKLPDIEALFPDVTSADGRDVMKNCVMR